MTEKNTFQATFEQLKAILKPYAGKLIVVHDTDKAYYLDTPFFLKNKQRLFFGAVRIGKAYVSFHLMPVYVISELSKSISPELKKRMQGKSCFNFKTVDDKLSKELAKLTKTGFKNFTDEALLKELGKRWGSAVR